jgi:hypothetical protein
MLIKQKLELIEKLESGVSVACICEEYGVKKQTVSDICHSKEKLKSFSLAGSVDASTLGSTLVEGMHMKIARNKKLDDAVYKWCIQQCSNEEKEPALQQRWKNKMFASVT